MSIAFRSAFLLAPLIVEYVEGQISYEGLLKTIRIRFGKSIFKWRLQMGRNLQQLFGQPLGTNMVVSALKPLPILTNLLIRQTHGKPF